MKKLMMASVVTAVMGLSASAAMADDLYKACAACHGPTGEMKAMNVAPPLKGQSKEDIMKKIKGYKDGSYGGAMKAVMAGQVAKLSDADIEKLADKISKF
ncbi:MAG TPA: c-type cytochrome [Gammaproteobacteria bacterium]|nr:c-type cytochrome [Gammaproteobacteria bacterium]